ncbi:MAG TPA: SDR family NAD(P)-dependent oxidoreductase [Paludibacter sp.]|nr:SDR family NAD(P)-dependent oxidoreductase [Paludibacter sp.]
MKKAIVIGATSGIGKELVKQLISADYITGITGRRTTLLEELKAESPDKVCIKTFDVTDTEDSIKSLQELVLELEGLDLLVISSGTGDLNDSLDFEVEKTTIDTNVTGFTNIADWGYAYFQKQNSGHLVAITSIAGLRGAKAAPAYNASKAYQISYLEALRQKAISSHKNLLITDIRPGFVDTPMAKGDGLFWVSSAEKAAKQIFGVIQKKKKMAYITKRWGIAAFIFKRIPSYFYNKF